MIDLHCHLCFDVDDGPKNATESRALARALLDAGVTQVACTSHVRVGKGWVNDQSVQDRNHQALNETLADIPLARVRGAEHYLDALVDDDMASRVVPYGESRYLLVELPYESPPPDLFGALFRVRRAGFRILLAHLERFPWVADDRAAVQRLIDADILIQVNLGSVCGGYHRSHKKSAERLLSDGAVSVAAGDCHRAADVGPLLEKGLRALRKCVGDEGVTLLTETNPRAILADMPPGALMRPH